MGGYAQRKRCVCHVSCAAPRAAFKALAYKKYQQVPLYLEWAPKDIWDTPPPAAPLTSKAPAAAAAAPKAAANGTAVAAGTAQQMPAEAAAAAAAAGGEEEEDGDQVSTVSIYVKNLNFNTSDKSLKNHFDKVVSAAGGQIHSAKVRLGDRGFLCGVCGFGICVCGWLVGADRLTGRRAPRWCLSFAARAAS